MLRDAAVMHAKPAKVAQFVKFALVGCSGVAVNTAVLYVLSRRLHLPLAASSAVAVEFSVMTNYVLNEFWTFAGRGVCGKRFAKFNIASLAGLSLNVLLVWSLTRHGIYFLLANLIGIGVAFGVNYFLSTAWVWSRTL